MGPGARLVRDENEMKFIQTQKWTINMKARGITLTFLLNFPICIQIHAAADLLIQCNMKNFIYILNECIQ